MDLSIIRPEMREGDIGMRGKGMDPERLRGIKKGLRTLHTLELMAVNIYKYQITGEQSEHNRLLVAAMCNEMTHFQDFQVKLFEYGWKPSRLRWAYWLVGFTFGALSRLFGRRVILRTGIWVEAKAYAHYTELLDTIEWDDETRRIVEKDQSDEVAHVERWRYLLGLFA